MNKKNNRKGFTIVELVIVIAVIAILATVLVPTFGNVIADAKQTALKQEAKNLHTEYVSKAAAIGEYTDNIVVEIDGKYYAVKSGAIVVDTDGKVVEYADPKTAAVEGLGIEAGKSYVVFSDEKTTDATGTVPTVAPVQGGGQG